MKKLKKALSLTLALALSLALALPASAADEEYYEYFEFSNDPNSCVQIKIAYFEEDERFAYGSFPLWVFPDDTTYTITIPDGGSALFLWESYRGNDGIGWGPGTGYPVNDFRKLGVEAEAPVTSHTVTIDDGGVSKWNIYNSAEYDDVGDFMHYAGEVLESIYFCTQSDYDLMIAEGLAVAEQTAEPEQPTTPAEPEQPSTPAAPSGISVTVGGTAVAWTDAAPFIDANSRTMVPLRAVADAMDLTVNWDGDARVASFTDGSKTISFPIDSNTASTSDGGTVEMDTAAVIANERTYAPIRYLAEYFGYTVGWDGATQTVSLTK